MSSSGSLGQVQAALVAALTGTGPVPVGFDPHRLEIARKALLRKRSGEVAQQWPVLAAGLGDRFVGEFSSWAAERPSAGSWRDGWDFAMAIRARSELPEPARFELARRRVSWRATGSADRARRILPAVVIVDGRLVVQVLGRVSVLGRR